MCAARPHLHTHTRKCAYTSPPLRADDSSFCRASRSLPARDVALSMLSRRASTCALHARACGGVPIFVASFYGYHLALIFILGVLFRLLNLGSKAVAFIRFRLLAHVHKMHRVNMCVHVGKVQRAHT